MHNSNHQHCMTLQKFYIHFLTNRTPKITWLIDGQFQKTPAKKYYLKTRSFTAKPQNLTPQGTQQAGHDTARQSQNVQTKQAQIYQEAREFLSYCWTDRKDKRPVWEQRHHAVSTEMMKGLQHLSHEQRPRELDRPA